MYKKLFNETYYLSLNVLIIVMQSKINNGIQLVQALNPLKNAVKVPSVDNTSDLEDAFTKIDKLKKSWKDGNMDYDLIRYLPSLVKVSRQGKIYSIHSQRVYASPGWSDLRIFDFNILLTVNTVNNYGN